MNTMVEVLEIWVEEEVLQHLLPKWSAFKGRGVIYGVIVAHLDIQRNRYQYVAVRCRIPKDVDLKVDRTPRCKWMKEWSCRKDHEGYIKERNLKTDELSSTCDSIDQSDQCEVGVNMSRKCAGCIEKPTLSDDMR